MDPETAITALCSAIDEWRWGDLLALLHPDLEVALVHTGERFDRDGWVRLNANYATVGRFHLRELVASGDRGALRARIVEDSGREFAVASFVDLREGLIHRMTEVWTDVGQEVPAERRG